MLCQQSAPDALARGAETRVRYVKSPGALYNATVNPQVPAAAIVAAIAAYDGLAILLVDGLVAAVDGADSAVVAESVGVPGDPPGAVAVANAVRTALIGARVAITSFMR